MKIDFSQIVQTKMTMQEAFEAGLFAFPDSEWSRKDWQGRLSGHAHEALRAYHYKGVLIGFIQNEVADFDTLTDWLLDYQNDQEEKARARKAAREDKKFA